MCSTQPALLYVIALLNNVSAPGVLFLHSGLNTGQPGLKVKYPFASSQRSLLYKAYPERCSSYNASQYVAKPSFIHKSAQELHVIKSPNHWSEYSCAITL